MCADTRSVTDANHSPFLRVIVRSLGFAPSPKRCRPRALDISVLINNLKTASARRTRNQFAGHLAPFYRRPLFWNRAYFVGSVGGATLETVRAYVDA
ncbi:transposase [Burkholderia sp. RF2-non_BP3]|uniref:transposase n=1 Tax=Burkholderia sp. RF2-non_BP3 TaxID=1637844 RepID=UPI0012E3E4CA